MKTLLLTGHRGFVGGSLLRWFPGTDWHRAVRLLCPDDGFDLLDAGSVDALVRRTRPDWVLHLAAQTHVPTAIADPASTLRVNVEGTARLLAALRRDAPAARLLYVSSGDVYGQVESASLPIDESLPPVPRNPYAVSKLAAELLCRQACLTDGLDLVIARPFNHTGPGQRPDFALSGFARSLAEVALGRRPPEIPVGNLAVSRDFSDVRDVCDGYLSLLAHGRTGATYNICSGRESVLADLLDDMIASAGIRVRLVPDPARMRGADQSRVVGNPAAAFHDTGWRAQRALSPLMRELVDHWRRELA